MAEEEKLKLGKGVAFVKGHLKRLRPSDEAWEADFWALPKPSGQNETHYLGIVAGPTGSLLAELPIPGRPTVNSLAKLLANAMRRPLDASPRRPKLVHLRGHHQWRELFPVLNELGVEALVSPGREFPGVAKAYRAHLDLFRRFRRIGMVEPTAEQAKVETTFPAIAKYVKGHGYVEIGEQEQFGFVVRAIGFGGLEFEDEKPDTLAEALAALEAGLARWFEERDEGLD